MNGHADTVNENGNAELKKPKAVMKDINLLGNMAEPPPVKKLPRIPKLKSPTVKKEVTSPVKSPLKSPTKHKLPKVKEEPESPRKPVPNGTVTHKELKKDSDDEDMPLATSKVKQESNSTVKKEKRDLKKRKAEDNDDEDFRDVKHKRKKKKKDKKHEKDAKASSKKKVKKEEEEVWRWWEEEKLPDGVKWRTLEHNGPYFPPTYELLPKNVKFSYAGEHMLLSSAAEEVATFYARMLEHDYTKKDIFNDNFFEDWRKEMTSDERKTIRKLEKCDFREIAAHFQKLSEERKNMSKEEKNKIKEANAKLTEEYGFCMMDGHKQKVGNFRIEPPGLFRGRGDHPKQGKLKKRLQAKDIIINIGKGAKVPAPPEGEKWKAVQYDNSVSWLACWIENIAGNYKYVMLNAATRMKGEKDWQKYEIARKLKECVDRIRNEYKADWKSKEMRLRQRGVAMYFIDKLALRAGHEKEEGESADTVGCCSLRVEHIKLHPEKDDQEYVVEFDFLGKDSIRYTNDVPVEKRVFKNLELFKEGKQAGDDLFDRLSTTSLNKFLGELMPGLSAKVFRTYNASITLQQQLDELTDPDANINAKFLQYNRANRAVAILCNHQRAPPKTFDKQMET